MQTLLSANQSARTILGIFFPLLYSCYYKLNVSPIEKYYQLGPIWVCHRFNKNAKKERGQYTLPEQA